MLEGLAHEFAPLWKLSKPGFPVSYLFGNIYSTHPLVTNMRGALNEQLSGVLRNVVHVFTEFPYPLSYKIQHILAVPSFGAKTCAKRNFKSEETYQKICRVLEEQGYILTNKNPKQHVLESKEINLDFILLKEMAYLLTSIELAARSHNSHDMRIIMHAAMLKKTLHAFESITQHVDSYGLKDSDTIEEYLEETCNDLMSGLSGKQQRYIHQESEHWINGRISDIVKMYEHPQFQASNEANNSYVFNKLKPYRDQSFLAVVGIGELKGLLNLFKQEGYTSEAMPRYSATSRTYSPMWDAMGETIPVPKPPQKIPTSLESRIKP